MEFIIATGVRCDEATIYLSFAKYLEEQGKIVMHMQPGQQRQSTMANGTEAPVVAVVVADVELTTAAGTLVLEQLIIDVLKTKCEDRLILIGRKEEAALGLKSMKNP